jgi:ATP-dependent helicase Lhr and Lhr-like helicase
VANYIYDGDAPLAERRAQALSVDQSQLRDLIGDAELRDLLDVTAIETVAADLQHLSNRLHAKSTDGVHDLLLRLGELTREEIAARSLVAVAGPAVDDLLHTRRAIELVVGGEARLVAVEYASRYRDALGIPLPPGLPAALLEPAVDARDDLVKRYARTHGPFTASDIVARLGLSIGHVEAALARLATTGRVIEGAFRPGGRGREWCESDVLSSIRRRSLARLREAVEPVQAPVLGKFLTAWHGIGRRRGGLDVLLDTIEQLQSVPVIASLLEHEILPARVSDYSPAQLDTLLGAGEVSWMGVEPLGDRDGRIALYLTDHMSRLLPPLESSKVPRFQRSKVQGFQGSKVQTENPGTVEPWNRGTLRGREPEVLKQLEEAGASFFAPLHEAIGGGFPAETVDALWSLVWRGLVTNDTLHALRAYLRAPERSRRPGRAAPFRSRRIVPPAAEGRWTTIARPTNRSLTEWATAFTEQLLTRHGVVTREITAIEQIPGGFSAIYPVLRRLEETGRVRRGYFVMGLGAAQFAQPGAVDLLRAGRDETDEPQVVTLAATDPANPYGAVVPWPDWVAPETTDSRTAGLPGGLRAARFAGARVVLVDGRLTAWIARGDRSLLVSLPADDPDRSRVARSLAHELVALAHRAPEGARGWLVEEINGTAAASDPVASFLLDAGFAATGMGLQLRVLRRLSSSSPSP